MAGLESNGTLTPSAELLAACKSVMASQRVTEPEVLACIADVHAKSGGYTLDPHSAVGVAAAVKQGGTTAKSPMVCLACAHWAKVRRAGSAPIPAPPSILAPPPPTSLAALTVGSSPTRSSLPSARSRSTS